MKDIFLLLLLIFLVSGLFGQSDHASILVNFRVQEINNIEINESMLTFFMNYGRASGQIYEPVTMNATYNVSTTGENKKIFARLTERMPNGIYLDLRADAPAGARSDGYKTLNEVNQLLVDGISHTHKNHILLYFRMRANENAETQNTMQGRLVMFTITG
jgi:hypothetical protein